ncbi:MAG: helix-turn-helix domain-containing protein [Candidatus Hydrogenedens sp.]|nr:helix-turn-helix domain-containing protein [Candidatus Hydrogenedens sp.]
MEKILTVEHVAEILQVKAITVREMFRDRRIRGFKVGKAWRTTEKLLHEDIEAIARGENPADLPMPGTAVPAREIEVPKRGRKTPAPASAPVKKKAKADSTKTAPAKAAAKKAAKSVKDDDDTQQLLF